MTEEDLVDIMRATFMVIVKLAALPLLAVLAVGLVVSLVQAVTQINEQTLSFVPKLVILIAVLSLGEHFLMSTLSSYASMTFDKIIVAGGR